MNSQIIFDDQGKIIKFEHFLSADEADKTYKDILEEIKLSQDSILIYGKEVKIPRLQAFYADSDIEYSYSGKTLITQSWTKTLLSLRARIQTILDFIPNAVLINFYRDGQDSVGWHSDDEVELGKNPTIASISLGASRTFKLEHKTDKQKKYSTTLTHGSLIIMQPPLQRYWKHCIPKEKKVTKPRLNLTFRKIYTGQF